MTIINEPQEVRRYSLVCRLDGNTLCMDCYVIGCRLTVGNFDVISYRYKVLSRDGVTADVVWSLSSIWRILTVITRNKYDSLSSLHTAKVTYCSTQKVS
jgi:hypothetical protein